MPDRSPLKFAACGVSLPKGCEVVDSQMAHRISTGAGTNIAEASFKAGMEAIERFSIQYRHDAPKSFPTYYSSSAECHSLPSEAVLIGRPQNRFDVTTVGCAAGEDRDSAARRACLELIEHHCFAELLAGNLKLTSANTSNFGALNSLSAWLQNQLRRLDVNLLQMSGTCYFAVVTCSDVDFGRLTLGHSASEDVDEVIFSAASEAILSWRNMVELERNGKGFAELLPEEQNLVSRYRGSAPKLNIPTVPSADEIRQFEPCIRSQMPKFLNEVEHILGRDLSLIDLTHPMVGIPVIRAHS